MLLLANIAHAKLLYGDLEGTKTDMDTAAKTLDQLEGVENAVNAAYYCVSADYYKVSSRIYRRHISHRLILCRQRRTMRRTTNTRYSISPASTSRLT